MKTGVSVRLPASPPARLSKAQSLLADSYGAIKPDTIGCSMDLEPSQISLEQEARPFPLTGRPRVTSCRFIRYPSGRCRCKVTLAWGEGAAMVGVAEGVTSPSGELRCAAEACLAALSHGIPEPQFELVGVKALRAFDTTLVIASLAIRGGPGAPRLVGSVLAPDNPVPAAVKAVLHAVNRVVAK